MRSSWVIGCWIASVIAFAGSLFVAALWLPPTVATHFDGAGEPNAWSSRSGYLLQFGLFGAGMSSMFVVLFYGIRFLPASCLNVTNPQYWRSPENYPTACRYLFHSSFPMATLVTVFVTGLNLLLVEANQEVPPTLRFGPTMTLVACFIGGLLLLLFRMLRFFRKIPDGLTDEVRNE